MSGAPNTQEKGHFIRSALSVSDTALATCLMAVPLPYLLERPGDEICAGFGISRLTLRRNAENMTIAFMVDLCCDLRPLLRGRLGHRIIVTAP